MNCVFRFLIWVMMALVVTGGYGLAAVDDGLSITPTTNNGKKWRIAYYEGGQFIAYPQVLAATVRGLMELGWLENTMLPPQKDDQTQALWKWLAQNITSDYIEFVEDAYYGAQWDDKTRAELVPKIINRLAEDKDIDLIIAMGTWAGKDLANDKHNVPTIVLSTSDPLSAGLIKSVEDSGFDHVHVQVDPHRYERQIRLFHEIIGFQKLGIAYEDTVDGRSYGAVDIAERVAKDRGFEVVHCHTQSDILDVEVASESLKTCFRELAKQADAIYVTEQGGINNNSIPQLVEIANQHHIPTFSQDGSEMVKYGFLVSTSTASAKYLGQFYAATFAKVFNGTKPNDISQLFEEPPKIALNLKTAEIIGFDPPLIILGAADELFDEIVAP